MLEAMVTKLALTDFKVLTFRGVHELPKGKGQAFTALDGKTQLWEDNLTLQTNVGKEIYSNAWLFIYPSDCEAVQRAAVEWRVRNSEGGKSWEPAEWTYDCKAGEVYTRYGRMLQSSQQVLGPFMAWLSKQLAAQTRVCISIKVTGLIRLSVAAGLR